MAGFSNAESPAKWSWSVARRDRLCVENFRGDASRVKHMSRSHAFHKHLIRSDSDHPSDSDTNATGHNFALQGMLFIPQYQGEQDRWQHNLVMVTGVQYSET